MSYDIQVKSNSGDGKSTAIIKISSHEGTERVINISPNDEIMVKGLEGKNVVIEVKGNDIIIHCEGQQDVILSDFYATDRDSLPSLFLQGIPASRIETNAQIPNYEEYRIETDETGSTNNDGASDGTVLFLQTVDELAGTTTEGNGIIFDPVFTAPEFSTTEFTTFSPTTNFNPPPNPGGPTFGEIRVPVISTFTINSGSTLDNITNNNTPTILGTAGENAPVTLVIGSVTYGITTADGTGHWSINITQPLPDGTYNFEAHTGSSSNSNTYPVVIDATPPAAPIITNFNTDSGTLGDHITNDTTPILTGTAEIHSTVSLYQDGTFIGSFVVNDTGTWTFDVTGLTDGNTYTFTATATDIADNTSTPSSDFNIIIDNSAPSAPVITDFSTDSGVTGDHLTSDTTPTLTGTAEANSTVTLYQNGDFIGTTLADGTGHWTFDVTNLINGNTYTFDAISSDAAGNISAPSNDFDIAIDTSAPVNPTIDSFSADSGVTGDHLTNDTTPTLTGTAEINSTVSLYQDGTFIGTTLADGTGHWTFDVTGLVDGNTYTFDAISSDAAGNTSAPSNDFDIAIDTSAPVNPTIDNFSTDSGVTGDHLTSDTTPTLTGTAEINSTVSLYQDGTFIGTTLADGTGHWTFDVTGLVDGNTYTFDAISSDAAGNTSAPSNDFDIAIDTSAPVNPTITNFSTDSGVTGDHLTSDTTPTLTGTAEINSTVSLYQDGTFIGTTLADGTGHWTFDVTGLVDGNTYTFDAISSDAAGNTSAPSNDFDIAIDTSAPVNPTIDNFSTDSGVTGDHLTSDTTPTLTGTAEINSTVSLYQDGTFIGTTLADGTGHWTFDVTGLIDGNTYTFDAISSDAAGNTSAPSNDFDIAIDTSAPVNPTIDSFSADSGVTGDHLTSDTTPTLTGTAEINSTVSLYQDGTFIGTTLADGTGHWTFDVTGLIDGNTYTFDAISSDAAGNTSAPSNDFDIAIDTSAPVNPTIDSFSTDSGVTGDHLTSDTTPTLTGTAEINSTVSLYQDGTFIGTTLADGTGHWTFDVTGLIDGNTYTFDAISSDAAGNTSAPSNDFDIAIDTSAPVNPTIDNFSTDSGVTGDHLTSDTTPTLTGTAEINSTVSLYQDGTFIGTTLSDGTGHWTFDVTGLVDGNTYTFDAISSDAAGNTSAPSNDFDIAIDTSAPVNPTITSFSTDSGVTGDHLTSDTTPTLTGTAEINSTVSLYQDGTFIGTTLADGTGHWTFDVTGLVDGNTYTFDAISSDAAGNTSAPSNDFDIAIDTSAPVNPTITNFSTDSGVTGDHLTSDTTPTLTGTAEINSTVSLYQDGTFIGTTLADGTGHWTFDVTGLVDGNTYTFDAISSDAAGNTSAPSNDFDIAIDTSAPVNPTITSFSTDSGVTGDHLTSDTTPTLTGTAEINSTVSLYQDGTFIGTTLADGTGHWTFDVTGLVDGNTYTFDAISSDAAGNTSAPSNDFDIAIDTSAPVNPTITNFSTDSGVTGDHLTSDTTPTLTGTAEINSTVSLYQDGTFIGTTLSDGTGHWTFDVTGLVDGNTYTFDAISSDAAGNTSAPSNDFDIAIDTSAPVNPTIDSFSTDSGVTGDHLTSDTTPTLTGTAEINSTVSLYQDGTFIGTTLADGTGHWTFDVTGLVDGNTYTFDAISSDAAGNTSAPSNDFDIAIDTSSPVNPTITSFSTDSGVTGDHLTSDTTPTLTGTAEINSTVSLYQDGTFIGTTLSDGTGHWTFDVTGLVDGNTYTFDAISSDAAGNTSAPSNDFDIAIDTSAPVNPTIDSFSADSGVTGDHLTSDTTPTLTGTAEINSTVSLYQDGTFIGTTLSDGTGHWTFDVTGLVDGNTYTFDAISSDAAGNTSAPSNDFDIAIDTSAPVNPTIDNFSTDSGVTGDHLTSDTTPTLTGTAEINSTVSLYQDGTFIGTTLADGTGHWTFDVTGLVDGNTYTFDAISSDAAGNTSAPSNDFDIAIDTSAPVNPTIDSFSADSGVTGDHLTSDTTPTLTGTAEINSTVSLYQDGTFIGTTLADGTGHWTFDVTGLVDGNTYTFDAISSDAAGNTSAPSNDFDIAIDTSAPVNPTIDSFSTDSGVTGDHLTSDTTPTLTGTAEINSTVSLYQDGTFIGTTLADGTGHWTFDVTGLVDGNTYTFDAISSDAAGNTSAPSNDFDIAIDTSAPVNPTITSFSTDSGVTGDHLTSDTTPTLTGTAEINSTVSLYQDGTFIGTTLADGTGHWTFDVTGLVDGNTYTFDAISSDAAGNTSSPSNDFDIAIDTSAPVNPTIDSFSADSGVTGDHLTSDTTPTLTGTAEINSTVSLYQDGTFIGTTLSDGTGHWTFDVTGLVDGNTYTFDAISSDAAGNTSAPSNDFDIAIDTSAPVNPTITNFSTDSGVTGDHLTSDTTPTLTGTAEINSTVSLYQDGTFIGTTLADGTGHWTFDVTGLVDGNTYTFDAISSDAAGNTSAPSNDFDIAIDTSAPVNPTITNFSTDSGVTGDHLTSDTTPTLTGTAEINSTVSLYQDGTFIGTTLSDGTGHWTFDVTGLVDGNTYTFDAISSDAAGNTSAPSNDFDIAIDTSAPINPTITSFSTDSGVTGDHLTSDTTPTLTGTAEINSTVSLYQDGTFIGTTLSDGTGHWTFDVTGLVDGNTYTFDAISSDAAGNTSAPSNDFDIAIDTSAPINPTITSFSTDSGVTGDHLTSDTTPTLTGTAEINSTVSLYQDGTFIGTTLSDGTGHWTFDVTGLVDGNTYTFDAISSDAAGNTSSPSNDFDIAIDTSAPVNPTITSFSSDSGVTGDHLTSDTTPTLTGTAEINSTVSLYQDGTFIGTTLADGTGHWTFDVTGLVDGNTYTFDAISSDAAGNTSAPSNDFDIAIDTSAPVNPTITNFSTDSGVTGDHLTSDTTPTLTGTAEINSTVSLYQDGTFIGTTLADGTGHWTFDVTGLFDGNTYTFDAISSDAAGNTSAPSNDFDIAIDTSAPINPTIDNFSTDSGVTGDHLTSDTTPTLTGTAEINSTVSLYQDGTFIGTTLADGTGHWTFDVTGLVDGNTYTFDAISSDAAGNTSSPSNDFDIAIDTSAPVNPTITNFSTDSGVTGDHLTSDTTPTLTGTAEINSTVSLYQDGTFIGTTLADGTGHWTFDVTGLVDGNTYTFDAISSDAAGNTSAPSNDFDIAIDTSAPVNPTITSFSTDSGVTGDHLTSDTTPTLTGTAEINSTVSLYQDGTFIGTTLADGTGHWTFDVTGLIDGNTYTFDAISSDAAGNTSSPSNDFDIAIDTSAPVNPTITSFSTDSGVTGDHLTSDTTPTLTGTAEINSTVSLYQDGTFIGTTLADGTGHWTFDVTGLIDGNTYTFDAISSDAAGNTSAPSNDFDIAIDTSSPVNPTITSFSTDTGITGDHITSDTTPTLTGTAEINSTVSLYQDGTFIGTTLANGTGHWTFDVTGLANNTTYTFSATSTDAAGNSSIPSNDFDIAIDSSISTPNITNFSDNSGSTLDHLTKDNTPLLTGTADANTTVSIFQGTSFIGTAVANGSGGWSFQISTTLSDSTYTYTAHASDSAGNTSAPSTPFDITIDTAIATPIITNFSDNTGSTVDHLTKDNTPLLTGTADANTTVSIFQGTSFLGTAVANGSGGWSFQVSTGLADGTYNYTVKATDLADNTSATSAPFDITIDTAIATPIITNFSDNTGSTVDHLTKDNTPLLTGTADANTTVSIFQGTSFLGTAVANGSGGWSFQVTTGLADGTYNYTVKATDLADNTSATSAPFDITIDTAIATPVITNFSDNTGSTVDHLTKDNTPLLTGTADANTTVSIFQGTSFLGTAVANGSGGWSFQVTTGLADGTYNYTVKATDLADNTSATSAPFDITIDTAIGTPSITNFSDNTGSTLDRLTKDNTPLLTGSADANSTVTIFQGTLSIGVATANALGVWSFQISTGLPDSIYTYTVKATDLADNTSATSSPFTITIDTAIATPNITNFSTNSGSTLDNLTKDNTPLLTGSADANTTVTIFQGTASIGVATANGSGVWSFQVTTGLADGTYNYTVKATDLADNTSATSSPFAITIDTAIATPSITNFSDNTGSTLDRLTKDNTPLLTGTAEANSTVSVFQGTSFIGTAVANGSGGWSFQVSTSLPDAIYSYTVKATDLADNTSATSSPFTITIDTAIGTPSITNFSTNSGSTLDKLTNDNTPLLTGTADANTTVSIFQGTSFLGTAVASGLGGWSFQVSTGLADGTYNYTVKATDLADNTSATSSPFAITIDTAIATPSITNFSTNSGSTLDHLTNDNTPLLTGSAEANSTVSLFQGTSFLGTAIANGSGGWSFQISTSLADGTYNYTVKASDAAANTSATSSPFAITIDTLISQPWIDDFSDNTGNNDDHLTKDTTPLLTGSADANTTVTIFQGTSLIGVVTADGSGNWSFQISAGLSDATYTYTAIATDLAGNTSIPSDPFNITIDTSISAPSITNFSTNSGSTLDHLTKDNTPLLTGTADAESTVSIFQGTSFLGIAYADGSGNWSFQVSTTLANGTYNYTVISTDEADNTSSTSSPFDITIDTSIATPSITNFSDNTGSTLDRLTKDNTPLLTGTADANSTVSIFQGTSFLGTAISNGSGGWSFQVTTGLADGTYNYTVKATDLADNTSATSSPFTITIDTAIATPSITNFSDNTGSTLDRLTKDNTPLLTGTAEANSTVSVFQGTSFIGTAVANGSGGWSFQVSTSLPDAIYSYTVKATDLADNTSATSSPFTITIDTAIGTPSITNFSTNSGSTLDNLTKDNTPLITGTAEANTTVSIFQGTSFLGTVVANGSGAWSFQVTTGLADGTYNYTVKATDLADNTSATSSPFAITIDTAIATPSITNFSDNTGSTLDRLTKDNTPLLTGTAEANSTVSVFQGTSFIGTAVANGSGGWSFQVSTSLPDAIYSYTVKATDLADNTSATSSPFTITIDTAIGTPSITNFSTNSGSTLDKLTNDNTPLLTGTADANSTVSIFQGTSFLGTAAANGSGGWSFQVSTGLPDATYTYTVKATDLADNTSATSSPFTITIDTTIAAPNITNFSDNTGSTLDHLTKDNTPLLTGTAEANSTVSIFQGTSFLGTVTANGSGGWSFQVSTTLANGTYSYTVKATDLATNTSAVSSPFAITIDTSAPAAPTITTFSTNSGSTLDKLTNDNTPLLSGTAEANSTVSVFQGTSFIGTAVTNGSGGWSFQVSTGLPDATYTYTVKATDLADNTSASSAPFAITIDTSIGAPNITNFSTNSGSTLDHLTKDNTPLLKGTADANTTVTIFQGTASIGIATANASGNWSFQITTSLPDSTYTYTVKATDLAGNTSAASSPFDITIDTTIGTPSITNFSDNTGSTLDKITKDSTPLLTGSAEANSTVSIFQGTSFIGAAIANAAGVWSFQVSTTLADGTYSYTVKATDLATNTSAVSSPFAITIDTTAPAAPTITTFSNNSGSTLDKLTNDNTPLLSGTAVANSTLSIFQGTSFIGTAVSNGSGNWSFQVSTLADATYTYTAKTTDLADNTSAASSPFTITIDTSISAPSINNFSNNSGSTLDHLTNDKTPLLSGSADANTTVSIFQGTSFLGTAISNGSGNWSFQVSTNLADGTYSYTVKATDLAGNTSSPSSPFDITIDTSIGTPCITNFSNNSGSTFDNLTKDNTPLLSGTADANTTVSVFQGTSFIGTAIADGSGDWAFQVSNSLADGVYNYTVKSTDLANNTSSNSPSFSITIDTNAPNAPQITKFSADTGVQGDHITSDHSPWITGKAEANSTISFYENNTFIGTTTTNGSGTWSYHVVGLDSNTTYTFDAKAVDAAGNTSASSADYTIGIHPLPNAPHAQPGSGNVTQYEGNDCEFIATYHLASDFTNSDGFTLAAYVEHNGTLSGLPSYVTLNNNGDLIFTMDQDCITTFNLAAVATDPFGQTAMLEYHVVLGANLNNQSYYNWETLQGIDANSSIVGNIIIGSGETNEVIIGGGNGAHNILIGNPGEDGYKDIIYAGSGSDDNILYGYTGNNTLIGGSGADTFIFDSGDKFAGNGGIDTIKVLGANNIDLRSLIGAATSIEQIDLTDSAIQKITLNASTVGSLTDTVTIGGVANHFLTINGGTEDRVSFVGGVGSWTFAGDVSLNGNMYHDYTQMQSGQKMHALVETSVGTIV